MQNISVLKLDIKIGLKGITSTMIYQSDIWVKYCEIFI